MTGVLTKIDCTLCENAFGRYCVPKSSQHRPAPQEILRGGVWELDTINFMREHARDRDIVHAGMFFGDFLPGLSSVIASGSTLYGFEPNPENFAAARWTVAINNLTNIRMLRAGLGAEEGHAYIRTTSAEGTAFGGASYIVERDDHQAVPIDLVKLDEVIPLTANIGIIQLDVEGYEEKALRGGINTIRRCLPIIILETVPAAFVEECLMPLGYRFHGKVCDNSIFWR